MATTKDLVLATEKLLERSTEGTVPLNLYKYFRIVVFGLLGLMILNIVYVLLLCGICQTSLKPLTREKDLVPK